MIPVIIMTVITININNHNNVVMVNLSTAGAMSMCDWKHQYFNPTIYYPPSVTTICLLLQAQAPLLP